MNPKEISDIVRDIMTYALLFSNFIVMLIMWIGKARAPEVTQNQRIEALEKWKEDVDRRLETGNTHFQNIDEGNRVTQRAILALMSHSINGNDVDKLKEARDDLEKYLTE